MIWEYEPQSSIGEEVFTTTDDDRRRFTGDVTTGCIDGTGCDLGKYSSIESSKCININLSINIYLFVPFELLSSVLMESVLSSRSWSVIELVVSFNCWNGLTVGKWLFGTAK